MGKRRTFTAQFKAQIVLEVLTKAKSGAQVCREHNLTESVLSRWKQEFLERALELFERSPPNKQTERIAELERLVGRLTMELEMTKKAITQTSSSTPD